jgi:hypothetical protein
MNTNLRLPPIQRFLPTVVICSGLLLTGLSGCKHDTPAGRDLAANARERGEHVVAEYLKRDASPYRKLRVRLTIDDLDAKLRTPSASGARKIYELEIWRKQTEGETLTLTQVVQPADENDLAALSVERKGQPTVNVTYVSSTDQFRETGTNKMFFGGLTAQELLGEWEKYDYSLIDEKDLNGVKVYEVEGTLKSGAESTLARTRTLFREDNYLPAEMHLFDSGGQEVRTFRVKSYHNVNGREAVWITEIQNHVRPTQVTVETLNAEFPGKVDDAIFNRERLKQLSRK